MNGLMNKPKYRCRSRSHRYSNAATRYGCLCSASAGFALVAPPLGTIVVTDAGSFDPRSPIQCRIEPSANVWCAFHCSAPGCGLCAVNVNSENSFGLISFFHVIDTMRLPSFLTSKVNHRRWRPASRACPPECRARALSTKQFLRSAPAPYRPLRRRRPTRVVSRRRVHQARQAKGKADNRGGKCFFICP